MGLWLGWWLFNNLRCPKAEAAEIHQQIPPTPQVSARECQKSTKKSTETLRPRPPWWRSNGSLVGNFVHDGQISAYNRMSATWSRAKATCPLQHGMITRSTLQCKVPCASIFLRGPTSGRPAHPPRVQPSSSDTVGRRRIFVRHLQARGPKNL